MPLHNYLAFLQSQLVVDNIAEHNLCPALNQLLQTLLPTCRIIYEPHWSICGGPNFAVVKNTLPIGYVIAKAVRTDLDEMQLSSPLQACLSTLDNVLLTDFLEFRWFIKGAYQSHLTVRLAEIGTKGLLEFRIKHFSCFKTLLKRFMNTPGLVLHNPQALAKKLAQVARLLNTVMSIAYAQENECGHLHRLLENFRQFFKSAFTVEQLTDMIAQSTCYGLFAARCGTLLNLPLVGIRGSGIEADDRLAWIINYLVATLNRIEITAILTNFGKLTQQTDPVFHFYETFLAYYNPTLRGVRGVYYTPEPVVSYIVRSIDWILQKKFGLEAGLADNTKLGNNLHKVQILDPSIGTGTFLYGLFAQIYQYFQNHPDNWSDYIAKHLLPRVYGFELLMTPYIVAHMKLRLQLQTYGYDFHGNESLQLFLTNTLEAIHENKLSSLKWLSNQMLSLPSSQTPIMVILGNPPYAYESVNKGKWISQLLRDYYQLAGKSLNERNSKGLQDDYVKFLRFAQWCIMQTGHGLLAFVTNHGYLDNPTFRGMRYSLLQDFDEIYILDLHGNTKKQEKLPDGSPDKNVFDIQSGIAISLFIKMTKPPLTSKTYTPVYHADVYGEREYKYQYLKEKDVQTTQWTSVNPQPPFYLFTPQNSQLVQEYEKFYKITDIMPINSVGILTARDHLTIHFSPEELIDVITNFSQLTTEEARKRYNLRADVRDWQVHKAQAEIRAYLPSKSPVTALLYRPFDTRYTYYTGKDCGFICRPRWAVMQHMLMGDNLGLAIGRAGQAIGADSWNIVFCTKMMTEMNLFRRGGNNLFPLYSYSSERNSFSNNYPQINLQRKANLSPAFLKELTEHLQVEFIAEGQGDFKKTLSALDIFNYIYAVLYSPSYRRRYAEFLKIDFPRLPFTKNLTLFKQLSELGKQLVAIHLMQTELVSNANFLIIGDNLVEKIEYRENRVYINKTQCFSGVNSDIWQFHIGGYRVCQKWLQDRKGKTLNFADCRHYSYIVAALEKTGELMEKIDAVILFD